MTCRKRCNSNRVRIAVVCLVIAAAWGHLPAAAMGQFRCSVVEEVELPAERAGHKDYLTYFTCNVTGGELNGFLVHVSNRWELNGSEGKVLGAIGHASRGDSTLVYLTQDGTMENVKNIAGSPAVLWDTMTATAEVKMATRSAAHLSGKTFTMRARFISPGKFTIDAVLAR